MMGIEPTLSAWEAEVLPLNYTRDRGRFYAPELRQRNPWDRPARIRKLILFLIMSAGFFIFSSHLLEALPTESPLSVDRNLSSTAKKA